MRFDPIRKVFLRPTSAWIAGLFATAVFFFVLGRSSYRKSETSFFTGASSEISSSRKYLSERPHLFLQNVRFYWQKDIFIQTSRLALEAIPKKGDLLLFDRPESFSLRILSGNIQITCASLEKLINGRLLAFPESTLRKIRLSPVYHNGVWKLKVTGEVKLMVWVGFEGIASIGLDLETGRVLMENESVQALLNPYTKELLNTVGLSIEDLVRFPEGKGLIINGNRIYFEPFSVFPDPQVEGTLRSIKLQAENLDIEFRSESDPIPPKTNSKNFIFVSGGRTLFGGVQLNQGKILLQDDRESDPFEFSFHEYKKALFRANLRMSEDGGIQIRMEDSFPSE
ncbi:hypothetical protein ACE5IS_01470 [Leptospira wolffii]|uniref:FecR protein domain-containing protein n=1 Tax=Leptospira wolffii TaxID=409998 RepID=A0ABV5BM94_9LEPT|nr:hypothetical protein [Leptospira wolffii]TGL49244.1 hypothetical protein EHQ61_12335 [Leptospira wolffii]